MTGAPEHEHTPGEHILLTDVGDAGWEGLALRRTERADVSLDGTVTRSVRVTLTTRRDGIEHVFVLDPSPLLSALETVLLPPARG